MNNLIDLRKKRSEELRKERTNVGLSKSALSKLSGLTRDTINTLESGKDSWNINSEIIYLETLRRYAN